MFQKARPWERLRTKFRDAHLSAALRAIIGEDTTIGSDLLQTLLMIVLRNATTNSPWPLSNNPAAIFNDRSLPSCNLDLPLWQLVRASTAAPTYFLPEVITVGEQTFIFVDGGITVYNNPAFQLFLMATSDPYRLCWPGIARGFAYQSSARSSTGLGRFSRRDARDRGSHRPPQSEDGSLRAVFSLRSDPGLSAVVRRTKEERTLLRK
jgi:hypothetical protein